MKMRYKIIVKNQKNKMSMCFIMKMIIIIIEKRKLLKKIITKQIIFQKIKSKVEKWIYIMN